MTGQKNPNRSSETPQSDQQSSDPDTVSFDFDADSVHERRPESDPGQLPEKFGRYRIVRNLGEGGMGSVYLAHDSQLDGPVALKIPRFSEGREQDGISRFFREARAAFRIRHPGICPVHDIGETEGQHFTAARGHQHRLSRTNFGLATGMLRNQRFLGRGTGDRSTTIRHHPGSGNHPGDSV